MVGIIEITNIYASSKPHEETMTDIPDKIRAYIGPQGSCYENHWTESGDGNLYHSDQSVQKLVRLLEEATGWNWLDEDMPEEVIKKVEAALKEFKGEE